jgi:hypothetical protein
VKACAPPNIVSQLLQHIMCTKCQDMLLYSASHGLQANKSIASANMCTIQQHDLAQRHDCCQLLLLSSVWHTIHITHMHASSQCTASYLSHDVREPPAQ